MTIYGIHAYITLMNWSYCVSPYVLTVTWWMSSNIIIHHWSNAYAFRILISAKLLSLLLLLQLLQNCSCYCHYCYYCSWNYHTTVLLNTLLQIFSSPSVVELTTKLLILANILWLPLCRINKSGWNTTRENCCDPLYLWVIMTFFWRRYWGA
jgi:hypothetical protein